MGVSRKVDFTFQTMALLFSLLLIAPSAVAASCATAFVSHRPFLGSTRVCHPAVSMSATAEFTPLRANSNKMQVVLLETVRGTGLKGELATVKPHYANTYLIPKGIAKKATSELLEEMAEKKEQIASELAAQLQEAKEMKVAFEMVYSQKEGVVVSQKAGPDGSLFGKVSDKVVAEKVLAANPQWKLSEKVFIVPEIKQVGEYEMTVEFHPEVTMSMPLTVKKE